MARKSRQKPPAYTLHKPSGQARVRIDGKDHYLGPYSSPESRRKYARILAEWSAVNPTLHERKESPSLDNLTIAELLLEYLRFAKDYYAGPDGAPGKEFFCMIDAIRPVEKLYGNSLVRDFGPLSLKAVRQHMIELGWARTNINRRIDRVRRVFKWGVSDELVTPSVLQALQAVDGLREGRTNAKESEPVKPVSTRDVESVLPHLSSQVATMVRLQLLCGCRPGEIVAMREFDIDKTDDIWVYSPHRHKTAWRGHQRHIFIGPKAQDLIREFLREDPEEFLFRPSDSMKEHQEQKRKNRTTPLSCGNRPGTNRKRKPKKQPGEKYSTQSYGRAIARACEVAFPPPLHLQQQEGETKKEWKARLTDLQQAELKTWRNKHRWSPNQLRHSTGTEIRREFGVEGAQVVLGHARADVTQVYAERDQKLAMDIMRRCG